LAKTVFNPEHKLKIGWDLAMAIFVIYSVVVIPYRVGFNINPTPAEAAVDLFITAVFAVDILISFNTAYFDINIEKFIFKRKSIVIHYLQFWFWIDLAATIPFDGVISSFVSAENIAAVRAVRILRLVRLFKLYRFMKEHRHLEKLKISPAIVNVVILLIQIFFIAHVLACFWHFITLPGAVGSFPTNWVKEFNFQSSTVGTRYIASFYYVIVTMLTVGYGDIYATNQLERLYAVMTMLTGGVVFGALVAKVAGIIDNRNPQARAYNEKMKELKLFLADTGLPLPIRDRAKVSMLTYYLVTLHCMTAT
jgi:hypothetical protein